MLNDSQNVLGSNLECQYGLMDQPFSRQVLTEFQATEIESVKNRLAQNAALLKMLREKTDIQPFVDALRATHQSHLADFITSGEGK